MSEPIDHSEESKKNNKKLVIIAILLLILLVLFVFRKDITGFFVDKAKESSKPVAIDKVDKQEQVVEENPIDMLISSAKSLAKDNKYDEALYKLNRAKNHKDPEANGLQEREITMLIEEYKRLKQEEHTKLKQEEYAKLKQDDIKRKKKVYRKKAKKVKPRRRKDIIIEFKEDDSRPLIIGDDE